MRELKLNDDPDLRYNDDDDSVLGGGPEVQADICVSNLKALLLGGGGAGVGGVDEMYSRGGAGSSGGGGPTSFVRGEHRAHVAGVATATEKYWK